MSEENSPRLSSKDWVLLTLGVGNFLMVSVLGAYVSWKAQEIETRLSAVRTAGQYIQIVANSTSPDYAKGLALGAILKEGLLSADHILEAAYRVEDDSLEKTVVGPLLYQIAASEDRPRLPFGFVAPPRLGRGQEGQDPELTVRGWAIDDQGWSSPRDGSTSGSWLQVELGRSVRCTYPPLAGESCEVKLQRRSEIALMFPHYPESELSGFSATFPCQPASWPALLMVRVLDGDGNARNLYSRCIDVKEAGSGGPLIERRFQGGACRGEEP